MPRLAYRPTAVMALQIEQLLRLLGFLAVPTCHHLARTHARTAIFVQHEIGGLIFPAIPPLGEIYGAPCLWPRRSVPRLAPLNPSPRATVRLGLCNLKAKGVDHAWIVGRSSRLQDNRGLSLAGVQGWCEAPLEPATLLDGASSMGLRRRSPLGPPDGRGIPANLAVARWGGCR
jgi:hypothetical protein